MKNFALPMLAFCISALATFTISSCQTDEGISTTKETTFEGRSNPNSFLYPPSAHPFGKSYDEWGEEFWKLTYALDCDELFAGGLYELSDDVMTYSELVGDSESSITIPRDQVLLLPLAAILNDYPCPDPAFEPAEGQSLEEFLQEGAVAIIDPIENISLSFDGIAVENVEDYLFLSDLFYFTGNLELADCYDQCVTGEPQPGVHSGYMVMFKKMKPGLHTIQMHGEIPMYEFIWDMTLNITVQ